jgi:hypothetical protein
VTTQVTLSLTAPSGAQCNTSVPGEDADCSRDPENGMWVAAATYEATATFNDWLGDYNQNPPYIVSYWTSYQTSSFLSPAPKLWDINPQSAKQGASDSIQGIRFDAGGLPGLPTTPRCSDSNIQLWSISADDTGINVGYSIPLSTPVEDTQVWLENANGSSGPKKFSVTRGVQAPQIGGVILDSPFTGSRGTAGYVEVYGSDLGPNASVSITNNGQATNDVTAVVSWPGDPGSTPPFNQINVYCTVASGAAPGAYSLVVTNSVGSTAYTIITLQ